MPEPSQPIGLKSKWEIIIREHQHQGLSDEFLKLHEVFLGLAPDRSNVLHGEIEKCVSMAL
jgi:hypothetical protein